MIVKKIKSIKTKHKAGSIRDLTNYIRAPEKTNPHEKVMYASGRGFISDSHAAQREEMVALAAEAVRSKNPVNHYIISWHEDEQPSAEQIEDAVSIFTEELGLQQHQVIYALHQDTDNLHLHIAINRVHPDTLKCIEINRGFDIETVHRAIARIEHAQGWQREHKGRYQVLENGDIGREHIDPIQPRQPDQRKRDMENRTGEKSAERIAIENVGPIIQRAQTWMQLHRELAENGMRYEKTGSGATIFVGEVGVKASRASREASLSKLQMRLGAFQAPAQRQPVAPREAEPIKPDVPGWHDYMSGRKAHYADKQASKLAQDNRQALERKQLSEQQKARRDELLQGNWQGKGDVLNALRSVIAGEQAAEKVTLKDQHQKEREQHRQRFRPYPDLEQWQRLQCHPERAEQWRHRASEPQRIEGDGIEPATPRDIRAYIATIVGHEVHYTRRDEVGSGRGVSFVDKGKHIDIHDWHNRETTLAALQLSAQKWGGISVSGNDEYKAMCAKLAAEYGFKITNPELQANIQKQRAWLQQARLQAMKAEQLNQFERYAAAVGAERYRVTSIKMRKDGSKQTFILDKQDGITQGFTPQAIELHTPEMQRLQRRGENLYYTPISTHKHHILIDDMNREQLERLIRDGYHPAVVLESSPGNSQAIITVPKLGTPYDKDVGNRLAEHLNREYGDPKLSGCIHPHRAPGYENRKPKHQRKDGSYPEVRLVKAEHRECDKTLALASQIDTEYQRQAVEKKTQGAAPTAGPLDGQATHVQIPGTAAGRIAEIYQRHFQDVLKRQNGGEVDLSRVDSMIAMRMRVTGHDHAAIEAAIRQCAPAIRQKDEGRDWHDYAQRTVRYVYSAAGDRQAADLAKYRRQWELLEGREPVQKVQKIEPDHAPNINTPSYDYTDFP